MSRNLLVVDFDFFFYNAAETNQISDPNWSLYDWSHAESQMFIDGFIWGIRADAFRQHNVELPRAEVPATWWDRFDIDPGALCYWADSNAYAGLVRDLETGAAYDDVWLFDAHHDLYGDQFKTDLDVAKWAIAEEPFSCENWMYRHLVRGSQLHWRWPGWLTSGPTRATEVPSFVGLDAAVDDGKPLPVHIDDVFVCRSGAWVPPWCDDQFRDLLMSCPATGVAMQEDVELHRTQWETAQALFAAAQEDIGA